MDTELHSGQTTNHIPLKYGYLFAEDGIGRRIDAATATEWLRRRDIVRGDFLWNSAPPVAHPQTSGCESGAAGAVLGFEYFFLQASS